jgi:hypothetical protein
MRVIRCYRFVTEDLRSKNGDVQWVPGEWVKHDGPLKPCKSGLHASRDPLDGLSYVCGDRWYIAQARGKIIEDDDKFCASEMRIVKEIPLTVIQRFTIDCAERTLKNFEEKYPEDRRPREAIEAARRCLEDPTEENRLAARSAARSAAWSAAESAAWSAAESAAESAAWSAAESAAESAGLAARSAAWSAAESAELAARSAAWSATWSAEKKWQRSHLKKLIKEA